jgi:putative transposase
MSRKYKMDNQDGIYFLSFSTVNWVDVFTRVIYKETIIESLEYCIANKGLVVHGYVIMTNHMHLIISRTDDGMKLSDIMRDFKKFTAFKLIKLIKNNVSESRREWLLETFKKHGQKNGQNKYYQFWRQDNHPIILYSRPVMVQKINYIHNNPVVAGFVSNPSEYVYSSASAYLNEEMGSRLKVVLLDEYFSFDAGLG